MLIVRDKTSDISLDTIYIYNPTNMNYPSFISDKRTPIIDGLYTNSNGILDLTHHLHDINCNEIYLSCDNDKSSAFRTNFLSKLQLIMNGDSISNYYNIEHNLILSPKHMKHAKMIIPKLVKISQQHLVHRIQPHKYLFIIPIAPSKILKQNIRIYLNKTI